MFAKYQLASTPPTRPPKTDTKDVSSPDIWTPEELVITLFFISHNFKTELVSSLMSAVCDTPARGHNSIKAQLSRANKNAKWSLCDKNAKGDRREYDRGKTREFLVAYLRKKYQVADPEGMIEHLIHLKPDHLRILRGDPKAFGNFARERPDLVGPQGEDAFRPEGMWPMLTSLPAQSSSISAYAPMSSGNIGTGRGGNIGSGYQGGSGYASSIPSYLTTGSGTAYQDSGAYGSATPSYTATGTGGGYGSSGGYASTTPSYPVGPITWSSFEEPPIPPPPRYMSPVNWSEYPTPLFKSATKGDPAPKDVPPPKKRRTSRLEASLGAQSGRRGAEASFSTSEGTPSGDYQIVLEWSIGKDMDEAACKRWASTLGRLPEYRWAWEARVKANDRIRAEGETSTSAWTHVEDEELAYWRAQHMVWKNIGLRFKHHHGESAVRQHWHSHLSKLPRFQWVEEIREENKPGPVVEEGKGEKRRKK